MDARRVLKRPLLTEKATIGRELRNEYAFEVDRTANKVQIKQAVEEKFDVKVTHVRTIRVMGKMKRVRFQQGRRPAWKKAMVTLAEGNTIDVYEQI